MKESYTPYVQQLQRNHSEYNPKKKARNKYMKIAFSLDTSIAPDSSS
jgi:hypothetical protein